MSVTTSFASSASKDTGGLASTTSNTVFIRSQRNPETQKPVFVEHDELRHASAMPMAIHLNGCNGGFLR